MIPLARRLLPRTSAVPAWPTVVTVVPGDAFKEIPKIAGEFDFVFLDAWKRDYKRFFDMVFPRLRPRGLFLAHNVVNKQSEMPDFLGAIQNNPAVDDDDRATVRRRHVGDC